MLVDGVDACSAVNLRTDRFKAEDVRCDRSDRSKRPSVVVHAFTHQPRTVHLLPCFLNVYLHRPNCRVDDRCSDEFGVGDSLLEDVLKHEVVPIIVRESELWHLPRL